ncbi:MAG: SDR family NAD(P)-dependent oxidoreductase [Candidatus Helarchaeota archaeon]
MNMMKLKNKVAIITGTARGIGQSIAIEMVKEGLAVSLVDILPQNKTIRKIKKIHENFLEIHADLRNNDDLLKIVPETLAKFGKINFLINAAGIFPKARILEITREEWEKVMDINTTAVYILCREVSKYFVENNIKGKIINIASTSGLPSKVEPHYCHYSASKAAVISITKSFAYELMDFGITVNAIAPGGIATKGVEELTIDLQKKGLLEEIIKEEKGKKQPLKTVADPIVIAKMAVFLASNDADYITGAVFPVDGGRSII